jgi:hypothetical protein
MATEQQIADQRRLAALLGLSGIKPVRGLGEMVGGEAEQAQEAYDELVLNDARARAAAEREADRQAQAWAMQERRLQAARDLKLLGLSAKGASGGGYKLPTAGEAKSMSEVGNLVQILDEVKSLHEGGAFKTGLVEGNVLRLQGLTGVGLSDAKSKAVAALANFNDRLNYLRTGAASTDAEFRRRAKSMLDPTLPDSVFLANIELLKTELLEKDREVRATRHFEPRTYAEESAPEAQPEPFPGFNNLSPEEQARALEIIGQ